jgi:hypothetical protein
MPRREKNWPREPEDGDTIVIGDPSPGWITNAPRWGRMPRPLYDTLSCFELTYVVFLDSSTYFRGPPSHFTRPDYSLF